MRLVPGRGGIAAAVLGLGKSEDALALAAFAEQLPDGVYRLGEVPDFCGGAQAALAWLLGLYAFDRYKKAQKAQSEAGAARRRGWRRDFAHRRRRHAGPRPDQHAAQ